MNREFDEFPVRYVDFGTTPNSPYFRRETEEQVIAIRGHIPRGGTPEILVESRRLGPTSESSCLQIDSEAEGQILPNWKTLGRTLGISQQKFLRYVVWKLLFEEESLLLTSTLKSHLEALVPDHVQVTTGPNHFMKTKWKERKGSKKKEKSQLWALRPDHEYLLYSRILAYLLPNIMKAQGFVHLNRSLRRLLLGFLRNHGEEHFALKRAYRSQRQEGTYEKVISKVSHPMKPKRRRPRPPRRRRSSEDHSGKPGRTGASNKSGWAPQWKRDYLMEEIFPHPSRKIWKKPEPDPFAHPTISVDPHNTTAILKYLSILQSLNLLRRSAPHSA